jgi:putative IMPACT (imprinted ancient) family translation regulator
MNKTLQIDFGDMREPQSEFQNFEKIISDRGSIYSVAIARTYNREDISGALHKTKSLKNHNKATHHSWAVRISSGGVIFESKNDDGETGAGNVILRVLQRKNMTNIFVCVARWYGGIKLEGDRFKHVQDATLYACDKSFI